MTGQTDEEVLTRLYPTIPWWEPLPVKRTDGLERYVCRMCVAKKGLRALDLERWFETREEHAEHLRQVHARAA